MPRSSTIRRMALVALLVAVAAAPLALAQVASVTVANAAPTVTSASLPTATVAPTSGGATNVTATLVVTDLNGCNDLDGVTAEVRGPSGATHLPASAATYVSCAGGTAATYTWTFAMRFHDPPAPLDAGYQLLVTATDKSGATGTNAASLLLFAYAELAALQLDLGAFDFGASLAPNSTSGVLPLSVQNAGNVRVDAQVAGTDLAHASEAASIAVANLRYATAADMAGAAATDATAATLGDFDLGAGNASARSLYWQLGVPSGESQWVPSGVYTGTVTVSAVKG